NLAVRPYFQTMVQFLNEPRQIGLNRRIVFCAYNLRPMSVEWFPERRFLVFRNVLPLHKYFSKSNLWSRGEGRLGRKELAVWLLLKRKFRMLGLGCGFFSKPRSVFLHLLYSRQKQLFSSGPAEILWALPKSDLFGKPKYRWFLYILTLMWHQYHPQ